MVDYLKLESMFKASSGTNSSVWFSKVNKFFLKVDLAKAYKTDNMPEEEFQSIYQKAKIYENTIHKFIFS